jgi:hypothetical protein
VSSGSGTGTGSGTGINAEIEHGDKNGPSVILERATNIISSTARHTIPPLLHWRHPRCPIYRPLGPTPATPHLHLSNLRPLPDNSNPQRTQHNHHYRPHHVDANHHRQIRRRLARRNRHDLPLLVCVCRRLDPHAGFVCGRGAKV